MIFAEAPLVREEDFVTQAEVEILEEDSEI